MSSTARSLLLLKPVDLGAARLCALAPPPSVVADPAIAAPPPQAVALGWSAHTSQLRFSLPILLGRCARASASLEPVSLRQV